MTYQEALSFIHSNFWQGSKPGLERTQELLSRLGDPQNRLKFIHVAGTNGKGSFCAMLSSILQQAGLRVGCYTSPYILRFNERMRVNGEDVPDGTLAELTESIRPHAEAMADKPTEFELITALAMEYFAREECDMVVLECGMGGRLDSTNVITTPILSVITGISLDHTAFLGSTVEAIAAEKAGIIKEGVPVLFCSDEPRALAVIAAKAKEKNAPLYGVERDGLLLHRCDKNGSLFSWKSYENLSLPLVGTYQPHNAQNVLRALELLQKTGLSIPEEALREGLARVKWPARFERIASDPEIFFDGGHNPEGVDAAVASAKHCFPEEKLLLVTGVMADKDYPYMASRMAEIAEEVFCLTPQNPRALAAEDYAAAFRALGLPAHACASPAEAIRQAVTKAKKEGRTVLCLGSLYMYGELLEALNQS